MNFRRSVYKIDNFSLEESQVLCSQSLRTNREIGIFEVDIIIGTEKGTAGIEYFATELPNRFELYYNGNKVGDSKYKGRNSTYRDSLLGEHSLRVFQYTEDNSFQSTGEFENITITEDDLAQPIQNEILGQGKLEFEKNSNEDIMTLRVYAPLNNDNWDVVPICVYTNEEPEPIPPKTFLLSKHDRVASKSCLELEEASKATYYTKVVLNKDVKIYTDKNLTKLASTSFYFRNDLIYQVRDGIIVDIFPCDPKLHQQLYRWYSTEQEICEDQTSDNYHYYFTEEGDTYNPGKIYLDPMGNQLAPGGFYFNSGIWIEWTGSRQTRIGTC